MSETIKKGISKPSETNVGDNRESPIMYGIRSPKNSFDKRATVGGGPSYVGPSKLESRNSAISGGNAQRKKHVSAGRGQ